MIKRLNTSWYTAVLPDDAAQRRWLDLPVWLLLPMATLAAAVLVVVGLVLTLPDWWRAAK